MKNVFKKITSIAMALTLLSTGTSISNSFVPSGNIHNIANAAIISSTPFYKGVTSAKLNVRTAPYIGAPIIGKLEKNTSVNIYAVKDGWGEIKQNGLQGWISLHYVNVDIRNIFPNEINSNNIAAIEFVYKNQIMIGKSANKFDPHNTLTRAEFAQVLYNCMGKPGVSGSNPFDDVKSGTWYYDAVVWAYNNNMASGYGADKNGKPIFGVNAPIKREQVVQLLYKYAAFRGYDMKAKNNNYIDKASISDWAMPAANWASQQNIVATPNFRPQANATREECADMIKRLLEKNYKNR